MMKVKFLHIKQEVQSSSRLDPHYSDWSLYVHFGMFGRGDIQLFCSPTALRPDLLCGFQNFSDAKSSNWAMENFLVGCSLYGPFRYATDAFLHSDFHIISEAVLLR